MNIKVSGILDGPGAQALVDLMKEDNIFTLDLDEVENVKFAALRILMNASRASKRICILNANTTVAERFEDTGVSFYVNV